jgi:hypothetical protein
MFTTCLTLAAMLIFVVFPVLIPAAVHAVHAVAQWHPTWKPASTAGYARVPSARRLAIAG